MRCLQEAAERFADTSWQIHRQWSKKENANQTTKKVAEEVTVNKPEKQPLLPKTSEPKQQPHKMNNQETKKSLTLPSNNGKKFVTIETVQTMYETLKPAKQNVNAQKTESKTIETRAVVPNPIQKPSRKQMKYEKLVDDADEAVAPKSCKTKNKTSTTTTTTTSTSIRRNLSVRKFKSKLTQ